MRTDVFPILRLNFLPERALKTFSAGCLAERLYWMIRVNRARGQNHQSCQQQA
jgi:hypothetical protein